MTTLKLTGASGLSHWFRIYDPRLFPEGVAGIYAFAGRNAQGANLIHYIGSSKCLKTRLANHEVWPKAIQRGASFIVAAEARDEGTALVWERDLIKAYAPQLNTQHMPIFSGRPKSLLG